MGARRLSPTPSLVVPRAPGVPQRPVSHVNGSELCARRPPNPTYAHPSCLGSRPYNLTPTAPHLRCQRGAGQRRPMARPKGHLSKRVWGTSWVTIVAYPAGLLWTRMDVAPPVTSEFDPVAGHVGWLRDEEVAGSNPVTPTRSIGP